MTGKSWIHSSRGYLLIMDSIFQVISLRLFLTHLKDKKSWMENYVYLKKKQLIIIVIFLIFLKINLKQQLVSLPFHTLKNLPHYSTVGSWVSRQKVNIKKQHGNSYNGLTHRFNPQQIQHAMEICLQIQLVLSQVEE